MLCFVRSHTVALRCQAVARRFVVVRIWSGGMTLVSSFHDRAFPVTPPLMGSPSEIAVKSSSPRSREISPSVREKFAVTPSDVGERTSVFLRRLYPERTVDNVTADLAAWDIKPERIAAMLKHHTGPGAVLWLALIWAYGPEFLSEVHPAPLGWLSAAAREQKQAELDAKIAALMAEREQLR